MNFDKNIFLNNLDNKDIVYESEFINILNEYKPNKIYCNNWSRYKPLYQITKYVSNDVVKYYCNAWVDKTPRKIRLGKLYYILSVSGLKNFYI